MSFIRVKKIGKKDGKKYNYAYLVENKWRKRLKQGKKGSRQKVSRYLGKVVKLEKAKEIDFFSFLNNIKMEEYLKKSKAEIVADLVRYELIQRGFQIKEDRLELNNIAFEPKEMKFFSENGNEKIAIEMNEGFLCEHTLNDLLKFKAEDDDEHIVGIKLAKAFLEAGLTVPKEIFVAYFGKL